MNDASLVETLLHADGVGSQIRKARITAFGNID